ncbi:hypothetical protein VTK73DRAFT_3364 [Phialemonium thermophilum]|uniref:Gluconokinase n=1 Tax=Phialemonium thermophilum TaxID=223376 RepID=A0ABR3WZG9_9PEZI
MDLDKSTRWIWFIMGPTACGKTTVAKALTDALGATFLEGDDFHPKTNVEKMSRGEALTDADRKVWLHSLRDHETYHPTESTSRVLVVTCSALKRQYRDILREGSQRTPDLRIRFVYLEAPEAVLKARATARKGHYAGSNLVHSQFETLEPPAEDERDVVRVDVNRRPKEVQQDVLERVREVMANEENGSKCSDT